MLKVRRDALLSWVWINEKHSPICWENFVYPSPMYIGVILRRVRKIVHLHMGRRGTQNLYVCIYMEGVQLCEILRTSCNILGV